MRRSLKKEQESSAPYVPKHDLKMKEGQTIRLNIKVGAGRWVYWDRGVRGTGAVAAARVNVLFPNGLPYQKKSGGDEDDEDEKKKAAPMVSLDAGAFAAASPSAGTVSY